MDHSGPPTVVIETGTLHTRAGFVGDELPKVVFPTRIAEESSGGASDVAIGQQVVDQGRMAEAKCPMDDWGVIQDWNAMERIWRDIFINVLQVDSSETPVLLNEAPLCPKSHRERMCQLMFEQFNVPGLYIATSSVLSLYAAGRTTGVVVDIGDRSADFVPIYEGFCVQHAIERMEGAGTGHSVTQHLKEQLIRNNRGKVQNCEQLITDSVTREIKKKYCYVARDYEHTLARLEHRRAQKQKEGTDPQQQQQLQHQEQNQQQQHDADATSFASNKAAKKSKLDDEVFQLPDGQQVTIDAKLRFEAPEVLFSPWRSSNPGMETEGIHRLLYESITKCGSELRKDMTGSVILNGGSTLFDGFIDRLDTELEQLTPNIYHPVNIVAPKERQNGAWIGGSILASLNTFHNQHSWIQKKEYNESGPQIVHRKCF